MYAFRKRSITLAPYFCRIFQLRVFVIRLGTVKSLADSYKESSVRLWVNSRKNAGQRRADWGSRLGCLDWDLKCQKKKAKTVLLM